MAISDAVPSEEDAQAEIGYISRLIGNGATAGWREQAPWIIPPARSTCKCLNPKGGTSPVAQMDEWIVNDWLRCQSSAAMLDFRLISCVDHESWRDVVAGGGQMKRCVVAIVKTGRRPDVHEVGEAVRTAVELAGGLRGIVSTGSLVLIKPNLVAVPPRPDSGACTRASVCKALADLVAELGGKPVIAESSARGVDTEKVMEAMGYGLLRQQGYEVVDLKKTKTVKVPVKGGRVLKEVSTFELAMEADAIISVPVMKTHDQTEVTLSLKNLKGLVTDAEKRRIHQLGVFEGVCDLNGLFCSSFAVVDGITAQEGLGPVYGLPVEMGLIIAGRDLLAVDAIASQTMGFDPQEIPLLRTAEERGIGVLAAHQIEVVGEKVEDVRRRFLRMEEDERIRVEDVRVIHAEGSCTGCRNGVLSSLFDMIQADTIERAHGMTIVTGGAVPPARTPEERVVPVGVCCPEWLKAFPRYVKGCPPNNVDIVGAILLAR